MLHFLAPIIDNIESIVQHGGYSILFLLTILEGIPIIGPLVPGHTAVILAGFLIKLGILNWLLVFIFVVVGAVMGDIIGYYIGHKYGFVFLNRFGKYFFIKESHIEKAKRIAEKHTGKAVMLGRFSPITRALIPFAMGASGIAIKKFWFYDLIGVLIWAIASITIGYIFGASYHIIVPVLGKFIVIAIVFAILIVWGYGFINKHYHVFSKYEIFVLFFNLLGLYTFFKTIQDTLIDKGFMVNIDVWINEFFVSHITSYGLVIMNITTDVFSPKVLSITGLLLIIYFVYKKKWRYSFISLFSISGGLVIGGFLKEIIMRARPITALIIENDYSFPSGHAIMATIFFTLIIYFFAKKIRNIFIKDLYITLCVIIIILTGLSRLYLGVHWFSDVLAGISFGILWTTLMILFVRYAGMIVKIFNDRIILKDK